MRISAVKYTVLSWVSILIILIFIIVPYQGFLSVWGASLFGHYTLLRLWDEILLAISLVGALYLILADKKIRFNTLSRHLVWVILAYIFLTLSLGIVSYIDKDVTKKAFLYGLIVNLRYLIFFLVTWCVSLRFSRLRRNWRTLVLWPSVIVIVFGLLQIFVLPSDFLKHFGYGPHTIPVIETVNSNTKYIRIASTLRGANPLGAYLIIPISLLSILILKTKQSSIRHLALLIGAGVVLFYTYSRSALAGALVTLAIVFLSAKLPKKYIKLAYIVVAVLIIAGGIFYAADKNNPVLQNLITHSQKHSSVKTTSDANHLNGLKNGIKQVLHQPLGMGPGSAGPASVYNNNKVRIAENYYVQIGQEVGWLGLILFILINTGVGYLLWKRREDPLALALFASLIGISLVNMLSHAWSDDTLSYIWWGLAGIAMVPENTKDKTTHATSTSTVK